MPAADAARPAAEPLHPPGQGSFPTATQFFGALLVYFTLQIILRVLISSSLDLDESEQLVLTQKLSWGYGSQPPLYAWLQFGFFKIFGPSVFALSLFKNILLFCTYLFTYLNARFITRRHACAVAAAASLLFIPQIAWESQRDLTHSVLAAAFACATMYCFLRLTQNALSPREERVGRELERGAAQKDQVAPPLPGPLPHFMAEREEMRASPRASWAGYSLFGACAGLGVLSKFNFALMLVALALAALSQREYRAVILNKRIVLTIVIAALILLPNLTWNLSHRDLALRAAGKFKIQDSSQWLTAIVAGLKALTESSATFFAMLAVVYGVLFWKRPATSAPVEKSPYATLLFRMLAISYALIVLAIVVFRISEVRDRWLQPILIFSPVLAIAWLQHRLDAARLKWLLALAGGVMVVVTVGLHARIIFAEKWGRTQPWNRPYEALAQQLKPALASASAVMTDTTLLAGNLRLQMPDKIFTTPEFANLFAPTNGAVALVWDAGGDPAARKSVRIQNRDWPPPDNLADFAGQTGMKLEPMQAQYFSAVFKFHKARRMKVGVVFNAETQRRGEGK